MKVHKNSLLTDTSVEHNLCHLDNIFQTLFTLFMECQLGSGIIISIHNAPTECLLSTFVFGN